MRSKPSNRVNHYIYKTTLVDSERYYLGRHSTDNLDDGYMGSGRWVKSIKDKSRLRKEILCVCDTYQELLIAEESYINKHFQDLNCMNMLNSSDLGLDQDNMLEIKVLAGVNPNQKKQRENYLML